MADKLFSSLVSLSSLLSLLPSSLKILHLNSAKHPHQQAQLRGNGKVTSAVSRWLD